MTGAKRHEIGMPPCIYCGELNDAKFLKREHVIPQSFGKFGDRTPTLKCVCDTCNKFYGDGFDQVLARDSLDGLRRYKVGKFSKEFRPNRRVELRAAGENRLGWFAGVRVTLDGSTGLIVGFPPQLGIFNHETEREEIYLENEIASIQYDPSVYGTPGAVGSDRRLQTRTIAETKDALDRLNNIAAGSSVPFVPGLQHEGLIPPGSIDVDGEMTLDDFHIRSLAKVVVNFAAFYIGQDEVAKDRWHPVKQFVRHGEGTLGWHIHKHGLGGDLRPEIWSQSIKLRIWNHHRGIVGSIQFYYGARYDMLLVPGEALDASLECGYEFLAGERPMRRYPAFSN